MDPGFLKFAYEFIDRLNKLNDIIIDKKTGNIKEDKLDELKNLLKNLTIPYYVFGERFYEVKVIEDKLIKRKSLNPAQEFALEELDRAIRESGDFLRLLLFQLPTGSGKTLMYSLIAFYTLLYHLVKGLNPPKFVIAGRTHVEIEQIYATIVAVALAISAADKILGDPIRIDGKPIKEEVVRKIIITPVWGAQHFPCASVMYRLDFNRTYISRRGCKNIRLEKNKEERCPFKERIESSYLGSIGRGEPYEAWEVAKDLFERLICPGFATYVVSSFAHIVITTHTALVKATVEESLLSHIIISKKNVVDEVDILASFVYPGNKDYRENLAKRLDNNLPEYTILFIDEADLTSSGLHIIGSDKISINIPLGNNIDYTENGLLSELDKRLMESISQVIRDNKTLERLVYKRYILLYLIFLPILLQNNLRNVSVIPSIVPALFRYLIDVEQAIKNRPRSYDSIVVSSDNVEISIRAKKFKNEVLSVLSTLYYPFYSEDLLNKLRNVANEITAEKGFSNFGQNIIDTLSRYYRLENPYYKALTFFEYSPLDPVGLTQADPREDVIIYIKIPRRDNYLELSIARYRDPAETFGEFLRVAKSVFLFSATYDYLHFLMLIMSYLKLHDYVTLDYVKTNIRIIIYNDKRPNDEFFKIAVSRNPITLPYDKDRLKMALDVIKTLEEHKVFDYKSYNIKPPIRALVLFPAKKDVEMFEEALKLRSEEGKLPKEIIEARKISLLRVVKKRTRGEGREKDKAKMNVKRLTREKAAHLIVDADNEEYEDIKDILLELGKELVDIYIEPQVSLIVGALQEGFDIYEGRNSPTARRRKLKDIEEQTRASVFRHILEESSRLINAYKLIGLSEDPKGYIAIGTGANARGFDLKDLNYVIVGRTAVPPPGLKECEEKRIKRRDGSPAMEIVKSEELIPEELAEELAKGIHKTVTNDSKRKSRSNCELDPRIDLYDSVSNATRAAIQALGRLTRGRHYKYGFIADNRFRYAFEAFVKINENALDRLARLGIEVVKKVRNASHLHHLESKLEYF